MGTSFIIVVAIHGISTFFEQRFPGGRTALWQQPPFDGYSGKTIFVRPLPAASPWQLYSAMLPSQVDGLGALEQQLSPAFLSNVLQQMTSQQVEIFLPRFTAESSFTLGTTLAEMSMSDAFTPFAADFSGIDGGRDLFVSFVLHKAWGQVNEAGTEAAAATVVGVTTTVIGSGPPVFRADHPFIFLIRDTKTGSVLFLGRLTNPDPSAGPTTPALTVKPSAGGLQYHGPLL